MQLLLSVAAYLYGTSGSPQRPVHTFTVLGMQKAVLACLLAGTLRGLFSGLQHCLQGAQRLPMQLQEVASLEIRRSPDMPCHLSARSAASSGTSDLACSDWSSKKRSTAGHKSARSAA